MKANKFLVYLAIATLGCSFAVSCDDNDNPPTPPQGQNYNDTIIYIDERTGDKYSGSGGFVDFNEESLDGYRVIVRQQNLNQIYEIYIPAEGANLILKSESELLGTHPEIKVNGNAEIFTTEEFEYADESELLRFYVNRHDCMTVSFSELNEINYKIGANDSKEVRTIEIGVYSAINYPNGYPNSDIIFIQEGK